MRTQGYMDKTMTATLIMGHNIVASCSVKMAAWLMPVIDIVTIPDTDRGSRLPSELHTSG
jgi:hypothetical protein